MFGSGKKKKNTIDPVRSLGGKSNGEICFVYVQSLEWGSWLQSR